MALSWRARAGALIFLNGFLICVLNGGASSAWAEMHCDPEIFARIVRKGAAADADAVEALAAQQAQAQNWDSWKQAFTSSQKKFSFFDRPFKGEKVTGDFFHFSKTDSGSMIMMLGDANGHGLKAAVDNMIMQSIMKDPEMLPLVREGNTAKISQKANELFGKRKKTTQWLPMVTLNYNPLTGEVAMTGNGAPQLLLRRADGSLHMIHSPDLPLGVLDEVDGSVVHFKLQKGDMLVGLSDGMTEGFMRNGPQDHVNGQLFYDYLRTLAASNEVNHTLEVNPPAVLRDAHDPSSFLRAVRRMVNPAGDDLSGFAFQQ